MTFAPHVFVPYPNPSRNTFCVKCGRPEDDPVHVSAAARGLILASYPENLAQGQGRQWATTARSNWSHAYLGLGANLADRAKSAACSCRVVGRVAGRRRRALGTEPSSRTGLGSIVVASTACAASSRGRRWVGGGS